VKEPIRAGLYLASLFNYPQIPASNPSAARDTDLKVITPPADAVDPIYAPKVPHSGAPILHLRCYQFAANLFPTVRI